MYRSKKCIFLGYNSNYRGYRCLDPATKRIYLSRHVIFNEKSFPTQDWIPSIPLPAANESIKPMPSPLQGGIIPQVTIFAPFSSPGFHTSETTSQNSDPALNNVATNSFSSSDLALNNVATDFVLSGSTPSSFQQKVSFPTSITAPSALPFLLEKSVPLILWLQDERMVLVDLNPS